MADGEPDALDGAEPQPGPEGDDSAADGAAQDAGDADAAPLPEGAGADPETGDDYDGGDPAIEEGGMDEGAVEGDEGADADVDADLGAEGELAPAGVGEEGLGDGEGGGEEDFAEGELPTGDVDANADADADAGDDADLDAGPDAEDEGEGGALAEDDVEGEGQGEEGLGEGDYALEGDASQGEHTGEYDGYDGGPADEGSMHGGVGDEGEDADDLLDDDEEEEEDPGMYGDEDEDAYNDFDMGIDGVDALAEEVRLSDEEVQAQLLEQLASAKEEHEARAEYNQLLQRKLADYLKSLKSAQHDKPAEDVERTSAHDQEQRYVKALAQLQTLKAQLSAVQERYDAQAAEMHGVLTHKEDKAQEIAEAFAEFKREIMTAAENSRTGRPIAPKLIRHFDESERARDSELAKMRLTHIARRNQKDKLEHTLRQKEKLADGLHLIDFEQLKIENQTLNEKIEERNEELLKLRKKMSTSAHVLTHFKEKLQFVAAENTELKGELAEREVSLVGRRDQLTNIKQSRDALRSDNTSMKQKRSLVNSEELLLDFEHRKQRLQDRKEVLEGLQNRHSELASRSQQMLLRG